MSPVRVSAISRALRSFAMAAAGGIAAFAGAAAHPVRYTDLVPPTSSRNLVRNGSFEAGAAGWSSVGLGAGFENAWAPVGDKWGNLAQLHGSVREGGDAPHGRAFLRIPLGGADTPVFNFDYFKPVIRRELRPLAASLGWIEVTPGRPYTLSVSMRAARDGVRGSLGVQNEDPESASNRRARELLEDVTLTKDWQRYHYTFTPSYHYVFVLVGPNLTGEERTFVDVDAVQLEEGSVASSFTNRRELEVGIEPGAAAGVFTTGESATLKLTAANGGDAEGHVRVRFAATDFADAPVALPDVVIDLPANRRAEKIVSLPREWSGFYRIRAEWEAGGERQSQLLRIAIVPPRRDEESVLGVNHAYPTSFLVALAKKAGITWHRDWSLKWQHIEPERGKYRWDISDPQMNRVSAEGLNLTALIPFPSTEWNSTAPSLDDIKAASPRYAGGGAGDDQELLLRARWAWMPADRRELIDFVRTAVARYRAQVGVWEFLNEPVFTTYSLPGRNILKTDKLRSYTYADYLELLKATVPAIREANPKARIIGGPGTLQLALSLPPIEAGLLDYVDIFGVHNYPKKQKPEEALLPPLEKLAAAMKSHGKSRPLWMTEFSYFGTDDLPREPFIPEPGLWSEDKLLSEKQVADYTVRYCAIFLSRGGEKIFLHSGCTGSANKPSTESCLFADGAVRKVFPAVAVFSSLMGSSPRLASDERIGSRYVYGFETGRRAIVVLWDTDGTTAVHVPAGVLCEDLMGRSIAADSVGLTSSPVYFSAPPEKAREIVAAVAAELKRQAGVAHN